MRTKPENADFYGWEEFKNWADSSGVGEHEEDWGMWWECWKTAYCLAMND